jgi:transposase InsO family protein
MIAEVLHLCHDSIIGGHMGVTRTKERIKLAYWWPNMSNDIAAYIISCPICQKFRHYKNHKHVTRGVLPTGDQPFQVISVDLVGPLPESRGCKWILVIVDQFSKWPEVAALADIASIDVGRVILEQVICRFGPPKRILSNRGTQFTSELIHGIWHLLGIQPAHTTPYHPQGNGCVERLNQVIGDTLKKYAEMEANRTTWADKIHLVAMAYRMTKHRITGFSPSKVVLGRDLPTLDQAMLSPANLDEAMPDTREYVSQMEMDIKEISTMVRLNHAKAAEKVTEINASHPPDQTKGFKVGDRVMQVILAPREKMDPVNEGPFVVIHKFSPFNYLLERIQDPKDRRVANVRWLFDYITRHSEIGPQGHIQVTVNRTGTVSSSAIAPLEESAEVSIPSGEAVQHVRQVRRARSISPSTDRSRSSSEREEKYDGGSDSIRDQVDSDPAEEKEISRVHRRDRKNSKKRQKEQRQEQARKRARRQERDEEEARFAAPRYLQQQIRGQRRSRVRNDRRSRRAPELYGSRVVDYDGMEEDADHAF